MLMPFVPKRIMGQALSTVTNSADPVYIFAVTVSAYLTEAFLFSADCIICDVRFRSS